MSGSGFYECCNRAPLERSLRHAWLTQRITEVHTASYVADGARRIHPELTLRHGITVRHGRIEMLMRAAGVKGLPGNNRACSKHRTPTASDLVDRKFTRDEPNKLSVTVITEHHTREGKIYCAVAEGYVFEASRRVGWRQLVDSDIGDKRSGNGHFQSRPDAPHTHLLGPRSAGHVLGIHPPGARLRAGPVDGIDRRSL
ncbi:IS3 family transposase [Rhodococcus sp. NPDC056516]|uniref:IS3 family transposase n=1 Tax=Rhodococcus sp. NPDC056516 TaxID=3345847 RepID=UPI00366DFD34